MTRYDSDGADIDIECCPDPANPLCWRCRVHVNIRLGTLATNLAHAASLCAAFWQGWLGRGGQAGTDCPPGFDAWMPGCCLTRSG